MFNSDEQYIRYSRHLLLKEIGVRGQHKLLEAKILIVGVGGLGAPIAIYLAAAGVGTLGLVEFDKVDLSNLQRQILYETHQIGLSKVDIAAEKLISINPDIKIIKYNEPLTTSNALKIFKEYDYILDATDNFATRYLINDACVILGKTYVYGSIYDFEGQLAIFSTNEGPCYRCIFPEPPEKENIPGCLEKGVFGILPGVVGSIQATEMIKLICNIGQPIINKLLLYDALTMKLREMKITKNPDCPVCGENPVIKKLGNYNKIKNNEPEQDKVNRIEPEELYEKLKITNNSKPILLDVRELYECNYNAQQNKNSNLIHVPLLTIRDQLPLLEKYRNEEIITICQTGHRGLNAAMVLIANNFSKIKVLSGGINRWIKNYPQELLLKNQELKKNIY